jgi:hypothetical protein
VRLALRNYRDEDRVHTVGVTSHGMFDVAPRGLVDPDHEMTPSPGGPTVEIVLGDKVVRQPLL